MKKIFKVSVAVLLTLTYCSVFVSAFAYSAITEETIDSHLMERGVPEIAVQKIPFDLKKQVFLDNSKLDIGEPAYGVFTDKYKVEYTLENGQVIMDSQSREQLHALLNDEEELANVMLSKDRADSKQVAQISSNARTEKEMVAEHKSEVSSYLEENLNEIQSLQEMSDDAVVMTLRNWESTILCIHVSYDEESVSRKVLMYSWDWNYQPFYTLTDKVGMAWSGNFTAEVNPITHPYGFAWIYQGHTMYDNEYYNAEGYNSTESDPNVGIGTAIDIKSFYYKSPFISYEVIRHKGLLLVNLRKVVERESSESAVGSYFHKYVAINVNGGLSFSQGVAPSISISWEHNYDKAPDAMTDFWAMKGD